MEIDLKPGSYLFGDKAYTDYNFEKYLYEFEEIQCLPERKSNAKKQHSLCLEFIRSKLRKRIEISFSELTRLLPRKIDAVTIKGFLLKLVIFVFSFSLQRQL